MVPSPKVTLFEAVAGQTTLMPALATKLTASGGQRPSSGALVSGGTVIIGRPAGYTLKVLSH